MSLERIFLSLVAALAIVLAGPVSAQQQPASHTGSRDHSAHVLRTDWLVTNPRRDSAPLPGKRGQVSPLGGQTGGHAHPYVPRSYHTLNMITNDLPETIRKCDLFPVA
jgi:hypothetical protein